jgi:hypothetical protein
VPQQAIDSDFYTSIHGDSINLSQCVQALLRVCVFVYLYSSRLFSRLSAARRKPLFNAVSLLPYVLDRFVAA